MLLRGADVYLVTSNDNSCLAVAADAVNEHTDVVRALLSAGANVNGRVAGFSALHIASGRGHTDIVNILLYNGAQTETRDDDGYTPLWYAAANGHNDLLFALVSAGADVNAQANDGYSALDIASYKGYIDIMKVLLNNGVHIESRDPDNSGCTPLLTAVFNGRTDAVRALVSAGANVNAQNNFGYSALATASEKGYIDVVNVLLDSNASVETRNTHGCTSLWLAASNGHTQVIEALVAHGADVNAINYSGRLPLSTAAMNGHTDAVLMLIRQNANRKFPECIDCPIALTAVLGKNNVETILQLLKDRTNSESVNATDSTNITALMLAADLGRLESVKILIEHGADIHGRDCDNIQAKDRASYSGHTDVVSYLSKCSSNCIVMESAHNRYPLSDILIDSRCNTALHLTTDFTVMWSLLDNGANAEAENIDGLRPIHCAVRTGLVELVELMIQHGANVDAADIFGNRPLHDAVCHGLNVVQLLVQHEAKLNVQNNDGKTPLHIAIDRQQCDVIKFLLSQDADVGLTDVWRNTPLHYVTSELLAVAEVAEHIVEILVNKYQYAIIRNTVGMSTLEHVTSFGVLDCRFCKKHPNDIITIETSRIKLMLQEQTLNCSLKSSVYCRQESQKGRSMCADSLGNTPLHYAVGVYGKHKMFRVSTDVAKTVDNLVKNGADINAQNNEGLTPLHVARGEEAIKACLQHADDQSFTITDKRGRNFWHLLFLTRTRNEVELATTIRPMIALPNAKYNVDDLERTPFHYACMDRSGPISEWNWLAKEFIKIFSNRHVDIQDKFGRTALHYAAIHKSVIIKDILQEKEVTRIDILKEKKADDTITDKFHMTAEKYTSARNRLVMFSLRLTETSGFIARNKRAITQCVQKYCLANTTDSVAECKTEIRKIVCNLRSNETSFVQSISSGCRYDYADDLCGKSSAHKQREPTIVEERATQHRIRKIVKRAMDHLAKEISAIDDRFRCEVVAVGSAHEGTKIGCCDEFDFNFVLTCLSRMCRVDYSPESPSGFVLLKASTPEFDEDLFNSNGTLNTRIVKFKFEVLVKQVLSSLEFTLNTGLEFIDPLCNWLLPPGIVSNKLHTYIKLAFTQPLEGYHVPHDVSVDIVPAIQINDWQISVKQANVSLCSLSHRTSIRGSAGQSHTDLYRLLEQKAESCITVLQLPKLLIWL